MLIDIAKQWKRSDKDMDARQFIDDKIKYKSIKYNDKGIVVSINLSKSQLSGPIPSSISGLSQLQELNLSSNKLSGSIPSSVGLLSNLEALNLSYNQLSGPITSSIGNSSLKTLNLSSNQLSGPIPASVGGLSNLEELHLSNNQLSGSILASIGGLSNLEELHLSSNQLSGSIPSSLGSLSKLKKFSLFHNKELSGAFPSMISKIYDIDVTGTGISRGVEIKTKPLNSPFDNMFVVSHVVIGYIDLVLDILAITALSNTDIPIMIANILFIVLSVSLGVWISRDDMNGIIRKILQLDQLYQGYMTIVGGHQTDAMVVSKKIDAVTRSMPSMILQLYGLLVSLSSVDSRGLVHRLLSPSQILLVSVASSVIGAGFTLASLAPNSGTSIFNRYFVTHLAYYTVEITNRIVVLSVMFFSVSAYGYIVAGLDFLFRLFAGCSDTRGYDNDSKSNLRDGTLLAIQSFGSDHTFPGRSNDMLYAGFILNTVEMFIFLIVLNTRRTPQLLYARSYGASTILTVVACVTWLIRVVFYYSGVLDIVPKEEAMTSKDTPMA